VWDGLGAASFLTEQPFKKVCNRYEISRCRRSAAVFYIVAYGVIIGTEAPGARSAGMPTHTMTGHIDMTRTALKGFSKTLLGR